MPRLKDYLDFIQEKYPEEILVIEDEVNPATFDVTLTVPREYAAIATTPALTESPVDDRRKRIRYATTPPLPTYLLAWAVGPFDVLAAQPLTAAVAASAAIMLFVSSNPLNAPGEDVIALRGSSSLHTPSP